MPQRNFLGDKENVIRANFEAPTGELSLINPIRTESPEQCWPIRKKRDHGFESCSGVFRVKIDLHIVLG